MKKIIATIFISLAVLVPVTFVLAANPFGKATKNLTTAVGGLGLPTTVEGTVGTVIKGVLGLVGTIFFVLTIYAGILWMTAAGNEEQVTKATDIIKAAVIGLFITMAAYAITTFVASKVGGASTPDNVPGCCAKPDGSLCVPQTLAADCAASWTEGLCPVSCTDGNAGK